MKIMILVVGKLKEKYLKDGTAEYIKRLTRFCDIEVCEVEDEQAPDNCSPAQNLQIMSKEAGRLSKKIKEGSFLIALDCRGTKLDSSGFAAKLNTLFISGTSSITFIIGGSLGLDSSLLERAQFKLSMSDMTFPHQLARLILLEQLYRSFKINNNETYHK